jgi:hypothetical protein
MAKPTEIQAMVKRSLKQYEFRGRDDELFRISRNGRVDALIDGEWRPNARFSRFDIKDSEALKPADLRDRVRRYFLPDLDGEVVVRKPTEWRRRFHDTRVWCWISPPMGGGAPRHVPKGPILDRCRKDYRRKLKHVSGEDLAEIEEQISEGYAGNRERIAGAEQRATIFLGASVLTSTLVLGNAGLLLGTSPTLDAPYLQIACVVLGVASACAIVAASRALQATMSTFTRTRPTTASVVFKRRKRRGDRLTRDYVASIFAATNRAGRIADWKIARMKSARQWILATMAGVVALTIVVLVDASATSRLVPEVPVPGEDHRHAEGVAGRDYLLVADRTARLDHRGDAGLDAQLGTVGEGEVGVGGEGRVGQ